MDSNNQLLNRIATLKEKFVSNPSDQKVVAGWEDAVKRNLILLSLKENKGVAMILDSFTKNVQEINELLLNATSKEVSDTERDLLLKERKLYEKFLNLFDGAEKLIDSVEKQVDENEQ